MRAKFSYDIERDFDNYLRGYLNFEYTDYGRGKLNLNSILWPSIEREILQANESEKEKIIKKCLNDFVSAEGKLIQTQLEALETCWAEKEGRYIERLEKYFGSRFDVSEYNVYLTTLGISPYNWRENWFMVRLLSSLPTQIGTMCHELMHLYFMNNFQIYLAQNGLSETDTANINESLTVLLNYEFCDYIVLPEDNKKPTTRPLQDEIVKLYRDNRDFPQILDRLIEVQRDLKVL